MKAKQYYITLFVAIANTVLIALIPAYFYSYLVVFLLGVAMFFAIIVMDFLGKTHFWITALYTLVLAFLSLIIGMMFII